MVKATIPALNHRIKTLFGTKGQNTIGRIRLLSSGIRLGIIGTGPLSLDGNVFRFQNL
jgi:hypothetical protein